MARIGSALSGVFLVALLVSPGPAAAQAQWDQAKVTAIAEELAKSVNELQITVRKDPNQPAGSMLAAQYQAREDLRQYVNTIERLALSLRQGEGKEETLPIYRRAEQHRRDAAEAASRADIPAPTKAKIEQSRAILTQLAPYYADVAAQ